MDSVLALHLVALDSIYRVPKNILMLQRFMDGPALNSGQRLDKGNQTHLVKARGKLVLQKACKLGYYNKLVSFLL